MNTVKQHTGLRDRAHPSWEGTPEVRVVRGGLPEEATSEISWVDEKLPFMGNAGEGNSRQTEQPV